MSDAAGPPTPEPPAEPTAAALPDDPILLRQLIRELLDVLRQTRRENEQLQHRLALLLRRLYGPRTERFDPDQILLIPDAFEPVTPGPTDAVPPPPEPRPGPAKEARILPGIFNARAPCRAGRSPAGDQGPGVPG